MIFPAKKSNAHAGVSNPASARKYQNSWKAPAHRDSEDEINREDIGFYPLKLIVKNHVVFHSEIV